MINKFLKNYLVEIILIIFATLFSLWLMWHTFSYKDGEIIIASKAWSDFGSHIPLIRSFSLGNNFPPQYPLFSGEPIRYHFLFYLFVGLLEGIGLPIDLALNIPSALSFSFLIIMVYFLAKIIFNSKIVGFLSVIFFIFNGSLSFFEFFKIHPLSLNTITDIINNPTFSSFGPYDQKIVSAFWNLNIYTNQRHLALPISLLILLAFWVVKNEQAGNKPNQFIILLWGIFLGMLLLTHSSIFIMVVAVLGIIFLISPRLRLPILEILTIGFIISFPRIIFLKQTASFIPDIKFGYLISHQLSFLNFIKYWFLNLGLFLILAPIGFLLSSILAKKIFIAFSILFIIGNIIQFSPEIAGNHKFFNVFVIVGNMFAAFSLVKLWKIHVTTKIIVPFLFFFFILSGVIDFFPIKNDHYINIADYPKNEDIKWIIDHTPKNAVFLNSSYNYNFASLAGRKIFLGWPYYSWSLGYNTNIRRSLMEEMFTAENKIFACTLLKTNQIDYVEIHRSKQPDKNFPEISDLYLQEFSPVYSNQQNNYYIFSVDDNCKA